MAILLSSGWEQFPMATKANTVNYKTKNQGRTSITLKRRSKLSNFSVFPKLSIKKSIMGKSLFRNRIEVCIVKEGRIGWRSKNRGLKRVTVIRLLLAWERINSLNYFSKFLTNGSDNLYCEKIYSSKIIGRRGIL